MKTITPHCLIFVLFSSAWLLPPAEGASVPATNAAPAISPAAARKPIRGSLPPPLTPPNPPTPQIHGAKVYGVHPGHPFLFTVPATGDRPMTFSAEGLPQGLVLDASSGQITGTSPAKGDYHVTLHAKNAQGETQRPLLIKSGDTLALTPPMGWNDWYCFATRVTDKDIRGATDLMVSSGLINHGWSYVNIDDYWENSGIKPGNKRYNAALGGPARNPDGTIRANPNFPDMKALTDYIHAQGFKAGIYSSPGPSTCGGCAGSYEHELQDAQSYAGWGFDLLKYDWCSYGSVQRPSGVEGMQKPYKIMGDAIATLPRDMVFSFCQYGMGDVWKWGAQNGGNLWRTTGDIRDSWEKTMRNTERQDGLESYAGPGHWNDPDMFMIGFFTHISRYSALTPDEQYVQVSLYCLEAAPLLISCDLTKLDPFTLGLLTNDEVIDVDQDPLGTAAHVVTPATPDAGTSIQIWARPLEDGSLAVGLVNLGTAPAEANLHWSDLKISGPRTVRDLWRQQDLGTFDQKFTRQVPAHGVIFVRADQITGRSGDGGIDGYGTLQGNHCTQDGCTCNPIRLDLVSV